MNAVHKEIERRLAKSRKEQMIYGETPSFDVLVERLNTLLERVYNKLHAPARFGFAQRAEICTLSEAEGYR